AKKSIRADVFRDGDFFKRLASRVGAAQLQTNPHAHARPTAAFGALGFEFLGQPSLERVEIHRFLEESRGAEILAILLGSPASHAGDDEDPDARRVTKRMQTLAEIKTGEL